MDIAPAAVPALEKDEPLAVLFRREFAYELVRLRVAYRSSRRDAYDDILAVLPEPVPSLPVAAVLPLKNLLNRMFASVLTFLFTQKTTSPPRPPSPPFGPPFGMYFSRLKEMQPLPPFPDVTSIIASSANCFMFLPSNS